MSALDQLRPPIFTRPAVRCTCANGSALVQWRSAQIPPGIELHLAARP